MSLAPRHSCRGNLHPFSQVALYAPDPITSTVEYGTTSGSLTIQEYDTAAPRIKGTFSFEGENIDGETIQVTEGSFDLMYQ